MTGGARPVVGVAAAGVLLAVCLAAGNLLGTGAVVWFAAGGTLLAGAVGLNSAGSAVRPTPRYRNAPRERSRRSAPPRPYPRYRQLTRVVEQALRDERYFDRVLVPLLRQLRLDLGDGRALPVELTGLLDPARTPGTSATGRPGDRRLLTELIEALETSEQRWT